MSRLAARKYRALFLTLMILIVLFPIMRATRETRFILDCAFAIVFLVVFCVLFTVPRHRFVAAALGLPTILGFATGYLIPGIPRVPYAIGLHVMAALFFGFTIAVILRDVYREAGVTADSVYGAFCGYLLCGLAFAHLYSVLELRTPGSFGGEGWTEHHGGDLNFTLIYFSFLTLTTVGYGDVIPAADSSRGLAVVEAIVGQFYIAVLVAELIGRRVSQALAAKESSGQ